MLTLSQSGDGNQGKLNCHPYLLHKNKRKSIPCLYAPSHKMGIFMTMTILATFLQNQPYGNVVLTFRESSSPTLGKNIPNQYQLACAFAKQCLNCLKTIQLAFLYGIEYNGQYNQE